MLFHDRDRTFTLAYCSKDVVEFESIIAATLNELIRGEAIEKLVIEKKIEVR
jgi:hypothetical protein